MYAVMIDGSLDALEPHEAAAHEHARHLYRHPAARDRRLHGHGGEVRIIDVPDTLVDEIEDDPLYWWGSAQD
jgi:hypothetical protein